MVNLANLKKLGINTTILVTSVSLAACGGGGGGYYGDDENSNENPSGGNGSSTDNSQVVDHFHEEVKLTDSNNTQIHQLYDNSTVTVSFKVLNADNGGVSGKQVRLSIPKGSSVTSKASSVVTDDQGLATFEINIGSLQQDEEKVLLTALVEGTSISIPYTLNIKKASVIVSDYNLKVPQGLLLNLPKGQVGIPVQVTDKNGGIKPNQIIELTLPEQMKGKFVVTSGSTLQTDAQGYANFTINANADLSKQEINELVNSSQKLIFKLTDENRAQKQEVTALTFKDLSEVVNTLEIIKPDAAIQAQGGTAKVKVYAKNNEGVNLVGKKIKLKTNADTRGVSLNTSEGVTNTEGYAEFILTSNSDTPIALSQLGIELTATYVEENQDINAKATIQVLTNDANASNQEAIQRLEVSSSYQINATNDSIDIKVKAIANNGQSAKTGQIKITLNTEATSNAVTLQGSGDGISFDQNAIQNVGADGFVTFRIKTPAKQTAAAIEALKNSGITASFSTDNDVSNSIKITVEDKATSTDTLKYLMIDPINETFDPLKNQTIKVRIKAIGEKGSLKNEKVSIKTAFTDSQMTEMNLSLMGSSEQLTDEEGYATFTFEYKYNQSSAQQILAKQGVIVTGTASNNKSQSTKINFNAKTDINAVALDYFTLDTVGSVQIQLNQEQSIQVRAKAMGIDGLVLANQEISIGIDDTSISNGVSYSSATKIRTNANGELEFELKINPKNQTELNALLDTGLTLALVGYRDDGSKYTLTRKIELLTAELNNTAESKVDYLVIDPILTRYDYTQDQKIAIRVKALDVNGSPLSNEKVKISSILSNNTMATLHLTLNGPAEQITDTNGYVTFEYSYQYAGTAEQIELIKKGVTFNAISANQKVSNVTVNFRASSDNAIDLDFLTVDTDGLAVIKTNQDTAISIRAKATGTDGKSLSNQEISIGLDSTATNNGVAYVTSKVLKTDAQGNVEFKLNAKPKNDAELNELLKSGLTVAIKSKAKDGSEYTVLRTIKFVEAEQVSQVASLLIDPIQKTFDLQQSQTIQVRVKAIGKEGQSLRNEKVNLSTEFDASQLAAMNLSLIGEASKLTDDNGYALFTFDYQYNPNSTTQSQLLQGLEVRATSNNIQSSTIVNFKNTSDLEQVALDYLSVVTGGSAVISINKQTDLSLSAVALGTDGNKLANQLVRIELEDNTPNNGVSFNSATNVATDTNGVANFNIKLLPENENELDNLIANGLTVRLTAKRADGSEYKVTRKINLYKSDAEAPSAVDYMMIDPLSVINYSKSQVIQVKVKALGKDGSALRNERINIASTLTSAELVKLNLSLNGSAEKYTDDNGYATFEYIYNYDENSTEQKPQALKGVPLVVSSVNGKQQTATLNFTANNINTLDYLVLDSIGRAEIDLNTDTKVKFAVTAWGTDGQVLAGQDVKLELAAENGVNLTTASAAATSSEGLANFELNIHPKNQQELNTLLASGLTLKVSSTLADGSVRQTQRKIELSKAQEQSQVATLVIDPILTSFDYTQDQSIAVRVKALDADGGVLKNEKVTITTDVQSKLAALNLTLTGAAQQITGEDGYATFVYSYKYANTSSQRDILAGVTVTASANGKEQSYSLNFRETQNAQSLDYITIDTVGKVAVAENVQTDIWVKVKAINVEGQVLKNQDVTLSFDDVAHENGFYLEDATRPTVNTAQTITQKTDDQGFITFKLIGTPRNSIEINNLLTQGYVQFNLSAKRADGSSYTALRRIELFKAPDVSESKVKNLVIDPINEAYDYTQDQKIVVRVKALAEDGSSLSNEKVKISTVLPGDVEKLHLTLIGAAERFTDAEGYATYEFAYKYAQTPEQQQLVIQGLKVTAMANNIAQSMTVNFKSANSSQILDYFTLSASSYAEEISVNQPKTILLTIDAKDTKGQVLKNQLVSLNLNEVALSNGVSLTTPSSVMTNDQGQATFSVQVNPRSVAELENLDANDLTVTVVAKRLDGTEYTAMRKVELFQPKVTYPDLAGNGLVLEYIGLQTISILGGQVQVKVVAKDAAGEIIANTPLAMASASTNSRVSLSDSALVTNSKGEATFIVKLQEGEYDADLVKRGINFAVVGTNLNTGERIQQTGVIQVAIPTDSVNLRLTADQNQLELGQTSSIMVAVKDELGANTSYPVNLSLNAEAIKAGVRLSSDSVATAANGAIPVTVILPTTITNADKQALISKGIEVKGWITNPKGQKIESTIRFTVVNSENPYYISLNINETAIASNGGATNVTAKLVDQNGGAINNQDLSLSLDTFLINNPQWINKVYINGPSTIKTDENGNANFEIIVPKGLDNSLISYLEQYGIKITAQHTAPNGAVRQQQHIIQIASPVSQTAPQYAVKMKSSKLSLSATGDTTDVLVYVLDAQGGGVANEAVILKVEDSQYNGVMIVGPSMLTTNELGEAKFSVRLDPSMTNPAELTKLVSDGLNLTATHNNGMRTVTQQLLVPVRQLDIATEKLSIVIARDSINLQEDATREYYLQNISVSVQDRLGKPVTQQQIQMDVDAIAYRVGRNNYGYPLDPAQNSVLVADWFDNVNALWNKDTLQVIDDIYPAKTCIIPSTDLDDSIHVTHPLTENEQQVPTNVVNFVGHETQQNVMYTTDDRGRVDLQIRYPKRFGSWLTVEISAKATNATQPMTNYYSFALPVGKVDITETTHPAIQSPYLGKNTWDIVKKEYICAP